MDVYYRDHDRPTSWGWLIAILLAVWVLCMYWGYGPQAPKPAPSTVAGGSHQCVRIVDTNEVASWIDHLGGWVDYDGTSGYWRDASTSVVGWSSAEDSNICSFVR